MRSIDGMHDGRRIVLPIAVLSPRDPLDLTHQVYDGLLDTGATSSWVTPKVISDIGLVQLGKETVSVATEERTTSTYIFRLGLFDDASEQSTIPYVFSDVTGFRLAQRVNFDVLIGMDILRQTEFELRSNGTWTLKFGAR